MKFDENLAAIHGYLCGDGYVIRNPPFQKHKYYHIGLRNTCIDLLEDFKTRCKLAFKITPIIYRTERCRFQSKEIYLKLTENRESFYSREWKVPTLSKKCMKLWLRAYFDCDGWVYVNKRENRHIGIDSVNHKGIKQVSRALKKFGIDTIRKIVKNGKMSRLLIYQKESLKKFDVQIGFIHPKKKEKLSEALNSYVGYTWQFPKKIKKLPEFIALIMKKKVKHRKSGLIRITSKEKINLSKLCQHLKKLFKIESKLYGPRINGFGTKYYELAIQKKSEVEKVKKTFGI